MKILALSQVEDGVTESALTGLLAAEAAHAWQLYLDGVIREAYFRTPPQAPGAVLVLEADSVDHARAILDELPLRRAGLIRFEVVSIGPFLPWVAIVAATAA